MKYVTVDNKIPFAEWLMGLRDIKARARIRVRLNRIRLGNFGDCEPVGSGVFELRFFFGPGYRLYFGKEGNAVVILLCGGDKSSQSKDIKQAIHYWREYGSR